MQSENGGTRIVNLLNRDVTISINKFFIERHVLFERSKIFRHVSVLAFKTYEGRKP